MPETMYSTTTELQVTDSLHESLENLSYAVNDLRKAGVKIDTIDDIRNTTKEIISKQLAADKANYFRNMKYIPIGLKRQADSEFGSMERRLLPLADALQDAYKQVKVPFHFKESDSTGTCLLEYDEEDLVKYIKTASTMTIPEPLRDYYDVLQDFIKAWNTVIESSKRLGVVTPTGNLIKNIMHGEDVISSDGEVHSVFGSQTNMSLTAADYFTLIRQGVVKLAPTNQKEENT